MLTCICWYTAQKILLNFPPFTLFSLFKTSWLQLCNDGKNPFPYRQKKKWLYYYFSYFKNFIYFSLLVWLCRRCTYVAIISKNYLPKKWKRTWFCCSEREKEATNLHHLVLLFVIKCYFNFFVRIRPQNRGHMTRDGRYI